MKNRLFVLVLCCMVVAVSVAAAPPKEFKAQVQAAGSTLALSVPVKDAVSARLVVAGPNDFRVEKTFVGDEAVAVNLSQVKDAQGEPVAFADGDYKWELRVNTPSPDGAAAAPAVQVSESSVFAGPRFETWVSSGRFRVHGGGIVPIVEEVRGGAPIGVTTQSNGGPQPAANAGSVTPQTFILDNFYAAGGICAGCANGDTDLDTAEILSKQYWPRLTMRDTTNDQVWQWQTDLGLSTLALFGSRLNGTTPHYSMRVEADTPDNTLYLDATGAVLVGTSVAPSQGSLNLYPGAGGTVAVNLNNGGGNNYLEYVNSGGYFGIGQGTDCAFCISPTALVTHAILIDGANVGFGTITPTSPLHARVSGTKDPVLMLEGSSATDSLSLKVQHTNGVVGFGIAGGAGAFFTTAAQHDAVVFGQPGRNLLLGVGGSEWLRITSTGKVGINMTAPTHFLDVGVSGAYCNGGAWVSGSSREYKQDIRELSGAEAEEAFAKLNPVRFEYKAVPGEGHVGFIAEDVPDLVAMPDRKGLSAMDVVAVLTKVVQEQQKTIQGQEKTMKELQARIEQLERKR